MLSFTPNTDIWNAAEDAAPHVPVLVGSSRGIDANFVAILGHLYIRQWLTDNKVKYQEFGFQRPLYVGVKEVSWHLKTKERNGPPEPHFEGSVPVSTHRRANKNAYYVFLNYVPSTKIVTVCGGMAWALFQTDSVYIPADTNLQAAHIFTPTRNIPYEELLAPEALLQLVME